MRVPQVPTVPSLTRIPPVGPRSPEVRPAGPGTVGHRSRGRSAVALLGAGAVALSAAAVLPGGAAAQGPVIPGTETPTVLDAASPIDVTVRGSMVAWLRPVSKETKDGSVRRTAAVVLDGPTAAPRTLTAKLPDDAARIAVGTDARKRTVLIVEGKGGAYVLPADGSGAPRKLAGQTTSDGAFSMRDGRVAFIRSSRDHDRVRTATAPGRPSRALYTVPDEYDVADLELGAKGAVALQAGRPRDIGITDILWLLCPGKPTKRITAQSTGAMSENGMAGLVASANGRAFSISRWNYGGGHPNDVQRFSSATARRLAVRKSAIVPSTDAIEELTLDDGTRIVTPTRTTGCDTATCLGLGILPPRPAS